MSDQIETNNNVGTKPGSEHQLLQKFVGDWSTTCDMIMPDGSTSRADGKESISLLGKLWAVGEGSCLMPDGDSMEYRSGFGYDVSFKGYRGFWVMSMSSHLWKYDGELSADGKVLTMKCVGPDMVVDGKTAKYVDVHTFVDDNNRTLHAYGESEDGKLDLFMTWTYTRA